MENILPPDQLSSISTAAASSFLLQQQQLALFVQTDLISKPKKIEKLFHCFHRSFTVCLSKPTSTLRFKKAIAAMKRRRLDCRRCQRRRLCSHLFRWSWITPSRCEFTVNNHISKAKCKKTNRTSLSFILWAAQIFLKATHTHTHTLRGPAHTHSAKPVCYWIEMDPATHFLGVLI